MIIQYAIISNLINKKVTHSVGFPSELRSAGDTSAELPIPDFIVIDVDREGFFLYRYTKSGVFCGDTWHQSIEDAKKQAEFEYNTSFDEWKEIPKEIDNPKEFILRHYNTKSDK